MASKLEALPPEVLLHILSYLDQPELDVLSRVSPALEGLVQDPVLHRLRLQVVAPSRINHSLFGYGGSLRPSVADLVHWGVIRGLGIERRWRMGLYFYSPQSVKQYETSQNLQRTHVRHLLSAHLRHTRSAAATQAGALRSLHSSRVLPDVESSSPGFAQSLLPIVRKLKWCIQRDSLARMVRGEPGEPDVGTGAVTVLSWFEGRGKGIWKESERVRLAICPGIGKFVRYYEGLNK